MGAYKDYLNYLSKLGLKDINEYDFRDKRLNVTLEIERMLNRSCMMFQWHGLPDTIPQEQLEKILQAQGYAIIGQINGSLYACYGDLGGELDEYYRPTRAIVSIPYLRFNADWEINRDCVVIKNDLSMQGMLPIYSKYANIQSEIDITLMLALINNRVQSHIVASDNKSIESAKEYIKGLELGKIGVIADNQMFENVKIYDKQRQDNITQLKELLQYFKGSLYNEIGIATMYDMKKERITQADLELNTESLYPLVDNMYLRRKEGIEAVHNMFGSDWDCEFNSSWEIRYNHGEPTVTKGDGTDDTMGMSDNNNDMLDNIGSSDGAGDTGNKNGMETATNQIQVVSDNSDDVSGGGDVDSVGSVDNDDISDEIGDRDDNDK